MAYLLHGLYDWYRDLMDNQSGECMICIIEIIKGNPFTKELNSYLDNSIYAHILQSVY